jgi:hypothetical protein
MAHWLITIDDVDSVVSYSYESNSAAYDDAHNKLVNFTLIDDVPVGAKLTVECVNPGKVKVSNNRGIQFGTRNVQVNTFRS